MGREVSDYEDRILALLKKSDLLSEDRLEKAELIRSKSSVYY